MILLSTANEQIFSIIPTRETDGVNDIYLSFENETTKEIFIRLATYRISENDILQIGITPIQITVNNFKIRVQNNSGVFEAETCLTEQLNDLNILAPDEHLSFLIENNFYNLKVYFQNTNEIIYKDKIFCTNQDINSYSINSGKYIMPTINNNDYITIWEK